MDPDDQRAALLAGEFRRVVADVPETLHDQALARDPRAQAEGSHVVGATHALVDAVVDAEPGCLAAARDAEFVAGAIDAFNEVNRQEAGRAGRESRVGEVIIQTAFPTHPFWLRLIEGGYAGVARDALEASSAQGRWRPQWGQGWAPRSPC